MKRLFIPLGLLLLTTAAQADSMSIIELENRPAEEVIPIIKPMLGTGEAVTGQGFKIFLQSSPETLARVKQMIDALDAPLKVLHVSVFQGSSRELGQLGFGVNAQIQTGNTSVDIGQERGNDDRAGGSITYSSADGSVTVDGRSTQESLRDNPVHQVRVTEGTEAYIETGERIPYFYGTAWRGRRGFATGVEFKDAITGFYVLPRVRGDNVILEVSPFKGSRSNSGDGSIETQSSRTTITGRVGEWLLIGGVTEQVQRTESTTGSTLQTQRSSNSGIWIKADLVE